MLRNTIAYFGLFLLVSCVPARLLDESKAKLKNCESELSSLKAATQTSQSELSELRDAAARDKKTVTGLSRDTTIVGSNLRNLMAKYDKLNILNEQLMDRLNKLINGTEKDNAKLSGDLQM